MVVSALHACIIPLAGLMVFKFADVAHLRGSHAGGGPASAQQALQALDKRGEDLDAALMLAVVAPIADHIVQGVWSTLLLRACWDLHPCPQFPCVDWMQACSGSCHAPAPRGLEVNLSKVETLMANLR